MCSARVVWKEEFGDLASAVTGRHAFLQAIARHPGWHLDRDACAVIYGELIANAVTHGKVPVSACVECEGADVRLVVRDAGMGFRQRPVRPKPYSLGGRGLMIVSNYATDLKIGGSPTGSLVSAALPRV